MARYLRWMGLLLGVILDAALAVAIAFVFEPRDWLSAAGLIFVALLLIPALVSLWAAIKAWAAYRLLLRSTLTKTYERAFRINNFPDTLGHFDIDGYLTETMDDPDLDPATRTKAAFIGGELAGLRSTRPFTLGMMASFAAERALTKYQDESWRKS